MVLPSHMMASLVGKRRACAKKAGQMLAGMVANEGSNCRDTDTIDRSGWLDDMLAETQERLALQPEQLTRLRQINLIVLCVLVDERVCRDEITGAGPRAMCHRGIDPEETTGSYLTLPGDGDSGINPVVFADDAVISDIDVARY